MPLGVLGSLFNRPPVTAAASQQNPAAPPPTSSRHAISRQYAYDRDIVQSKRNPVRLKRLSVAVVLNNAAAPAVAGQTAARWTPEQIARGH